MQSEFKLPGVIVLQWRNVSKYIKSVFRLYVLDKFSY